MPRVVPRGLHRGRKPACGAQRLRRQESRRGEEGDRLVRRARLSRRSRSTTRSPRTSCAETTAYAHTRGMRVSGHMPAFLRAQDVVLAGYDEIQHINQVLLNFLVTDKTDTRTLERFYLPAEKVAGLDFDSGRRAELHRAAGEDARSSSIRRWRRSTSSASRMARCRRSSPRWPTICRPMSSADSWSAQMKIPDDATACALREVVRQDDRVRRPHVQGRRADRGRYGRHRRVSRCSANSSCTSKPA